MRKTLQDSFHHIKCYNIKNRNLQNNHKRMNLKFTTINQHINSKKKINQLLLFKYKFLCHLYENSVFI